MPANRITQLFTHGTTQRSPPTTPISVNGISAASHVLPKSKAVVEKATGFKDKDKPSRGLLPGIDSARSITTEPTETGKPWGEYGELYKLNDLEGKASVAIRKSAPRTLVIIQTFTNQGAESPVRKRLEHKNICTIIKNFTDSNKIYTVFEHLDLTWEHIINCFEFPSELQLAALLGQVRLLLSQICLQICFLLRIWATLILLAPRRVNISEKPTTCSWKLAPPHCLGEPAGAC